MKHIINIVVLFSLAFTTCLIAIGLIAQNPIINFVLVCLNVMLTALFLLTAIEYTIKLMFKKRTQTNEPVKVSATLVRYNKDGSIYPAYKVFSGNNLTECITQITKHARQYGYKIKTLEQLTTED
jgi:biopolymer transport protein ExbD